jgi:hypothetical protein
MGTPLLDPDPDARDLTIFEGKVAAASAPEAALYIASLAVELARLAKRHDLDALAYLLEMAGLEADQTARRWGRRRERRA